MLKTKEDIYNTINNLQSQLSTSTEIDDVVIDGLTTLNKLRTLYKSDKSLFDHSLIAQLQTLKKSLELIDECFELIYDDSSKYNTKQLLKYKTIIPQNDYLLSLIDEKINYYNEEESL